MDGSVQGTTPAETLRPGLGDPRLWRGLPASAVPPSVGLTEERTSVDGGARPRLADPWAFDNWVATDAAGLRWGAGAGVVYLAGIAIPTCGGRFDASNCGFGLPTHQRTKYRQWLQAVAEIQAQVLQNEIMDRNRAIRARRDSIRALTRRR